MNETVIVSYLADASQFFSVHDKMARMATATISGIQGSFRGFDNFMTGIGRTATTSLISFGSVYRSAFRDLFDLSGYKVSVQGFFQDVGRMAGTAGRQLGAVGGFFAKGMGGLGLMSRDAFNYAKNTRTGQAVSRTVSGFFSGGPFGGGAGFGGGGFGGGGGFSLFGGSGGGGGFGSMIGGALEGAATMASRFLGILGTIGAVAWKIVEPFVKLAMVTGSILIAHGLEKLLEVTLDAASAAVQLAVNYERSLTAFEVFTGSAETARTLMKDMKQLAIETPFRFSGLQDAGTTLLGFGQSGQTLIPTLARLGDLAAGDESHLKRLALAFGEVLSEGRLTGIRARQFAQLGIGFPEFAQTMGVSTREFRELMREGAVGPEVVIETLNRLTNVGGRFYQMSERQNLTVLGQWNALRETIEYVLERVGVGLFQSLDVAGRLGQIRELVKSFDVADIVTAFTNIGKLVDNLIVSARVLGPVLSDAFKIMVGENSLGTWKDFQTSARSFFKELTVLVSQAANEMSIFVLEVRQFVQIIKGLSASPIGRGVISGLFGFKDVLGSEETGKFISGVSKGLFGGTEMTQAGLEGDFGDTTIRAEIDQLKKRRDTIRPDIEQRYENMETFDKVSRAFRKMFPGGPARPELFTAPGLSADAAKYASDFTKALRDGITPMQKYRRGLELINEGVFGRIMAKPANPIGAVAGGLASVYAPPQLTLEQGGMAWVQLYESIRKDLGQTKEVELPKAALTGSAEAVDIINRGQEVQLSIQQEVSETLKRIEKVENDHKERSTAILEELKKRDAFGILVKGLK